MNLNSCANLLSNASSFLMRFSSYSFVPVSHFVSCASSLVLSEDLGLHTSLI